MANAANTDKITLNDARDALLRSGYLIEDRLETTLRARDYYVEANEAYPDPESGKSRELDLYAMNALRAGPGDYDFIFGVLLIECVNNPQPLAFMTKEPLVGFLHHEDVRLSGLPAKMPDKRYAQAWQSLSDYLGMDKYHHYCRGRVATQYCSFALKKKGPSEWMATHDESHFDAFRKLAAAVDHYSRNHFESWTFGGPEYVNIEFYYPALVVQGSLLEVRQTGKAVKISETDHVQYRMSTIAGKEQTTYQIDVVTERFFGKFLDVIDRELQKTRRLLRRRHREVRKAITRIIRGARRLRSPEKIRAAMDF
jgi:hypothetical protein